MVLDKSKFNVLIVINCLLISSLLLLQLFTLNANCQRDGSSSSSSSSNDPVTFESRNRAAHIDGSLNRSAERFNSNVQTTKRPKGQSSSSSLVSSSSSIVSSANFESDRDDSSSSSSSFDSRPVVHNEPKILDERRERPERKERPAKGERGSSSDIIGSGRGDDDEPAIIVDERDEDKDIRNGFKNRQQPVSSSSTTTPSSIYSVESSSTRHSSVKKKGRSTRPPSSNSSPQSSTRSPLETNAHHVINPHQSTPSPSESFSSSSRPNSNNNNGIVSSVSSSSSSSSGSRPTIINGNFASTNVPKSSKDVNPFFSTSTRCGENITLSSLTTSVVSPGWTEGVKYPANVECVWTITSRGSHFSHKMPSILVRVKHLEIEQDEVDCPYDYLEIRGHKRLCGFMQNKEIIINSSSLVIVFHTDSNNEDRGFELELYSHMDDCTPEVKATSSGEITSPGFPKNYPDSTDCWTLINANSLINSGSRSGGIVGNSENLTISVTFDFIEMEHDDQCAYDFVEFFEVDSVTKKPTKSLGKYCDEKSIAKPDRASSEYIPDPRISSSSSSVSSLTNENVKSRATVNAKGPYLLVHFKSDQLLNLRGFKAAYKVEADLSRSSISNCAWTPDENSMTLTSPNHPKAYPPNKDCSLILKSPRSDQKIVLIFESFLMEIDNNCTFDRLEIYDDYAYSSSSSSAIHDYNNPPSSSGGGMRGASSSLQANGFPMSKEPTKVFCGHKSSKFKYLSGGPVIKLRFVSDSLHEHQGFFARYKFIQSEPEQPPTPVQTFTEAPQNASIIPGSSHLLSCSPIKSSSRFSESNTNNNNNNAVKNILWFKDNQLITDGVSENGTKLLIREFSQSDVGRYTCKYGSATSEAWLKVQNTDCRIIFRKRPRDIILSEGEFTILECNAISPSQLASKVTITWTKNGKKVLNNARVDKLKNGYLVINGVTKEDSGHYFCFVRLEDDPSCTSQAAARIDVNIRANVEDICGKPNLALPSKQKPLLDSAGKIVGGVDAQKGAFPWQVMFWDVNRKSFCGGALLNERWIATAAHCFTQNKYSPPPPPLDTILVRLGKFDQKETEEQELNTKIQDIIKHPDYNPDTFDNDLALVRVRDHIIFTDYIKPICIGVTKALIDGLFFTDNQRSIKMGHVTGWGQLKENGPQPRYLQELRMPIVDQEMCRKATSFAVTGNMFCAGYAQEIIGDACKGDSGGPFVGHSSDRWYLLGIVSWGEGCGRTGKYGYYTKVSNYIDWVKGLIKN